MHWNDNAMPFKPKAALLNAMNGCFASPKYRRVLAVLAYVEILSEYSAMPH